MTIDVSNRRVQYIAGANQTTFPYAFEIFKETDINVYLTPVGEPSDPIADLLPISVYSVDGVNTPNGNVILNTGATAGDIITLESNVSQDQETIYSVGGLFAPETVERSFDKVTVLIQELNELLVTRGLTYATTDQIDQSSEKKDNQLPLLPANTGAGIPIWTKNSDGALVAGVCAEEEGCSTLRLELFNQTESASGSNIVGYYRPDTMSNTTVRNALDFILGILPALQTEVFFTGDLKFTHNPTPTVTWILAQDGSIGNAASSATIRANADTLDLYTLYYDNYSDALCPVAGGRGANAAADFAANNALSIPRMGGRSFINQGTPTFDEIFTVNPVTDEVTITASATSGEFLKQIFIGTRIQVSSTGTLPAGLLPAPTDYYITDIVGSVFKLSPDTKDATDGTKFVPIGDVGVGVHTILIQYLDITAGESYGENTHVLSRQETAPHIHNIIPANVATAGVGSLVAFDDGSAAGSDTGDSSDPLKPLQQLNSDPHNIMQPSFGGYIWIKL